jgi:mannitol/fructose-specific phosphotransferase system IIA component (Ntr-type)
MKLSHLLSPQNIHLRHASASRDALLETMIDMVMRTPQVRQAGLERESVARAVFEREAQRSTAIGDGIAMPHARIPEMSGAAVAIVHLREPVDFASVDGQPVDLVFMILGPEMMPTLILQVQSQLVRFFCQAKNRQTFTQAADSEAALAILTKQDVAIDAPIIAADIMRQPALHVYQDTSLRQVVRQMLEHGLSAVAVLNSHDEIVGEINCDRLFQFGLPNFFSQLKSVSFIKEFDPFESYFSKEAHSTAGDVMSPECAIMAPATTLFEIIFALAVQKHSNVYIANAKRQYVGVVDRIAMLDNVINW